MSNPSSTTSKPSRAVGALLFAIILLSALYLRLWGILWGLPDALHLFSFHPDETLILTRSIPDFPDGLNIFAGNFLPHYYNYGSLPFYEDNFFITLAEGYGVIGRIIQHGVIIPENFARALLMARLLSVFFGVGTVWGTYALGRRLFGEWAGLLAMALLTVMPLHAQHSHFATVDVGAAFWQTLSMVYAAKVYGPSKWTLKYVVMAAITAAFCAATKYSGALVMLCLFAALALRVREGSLERKRGFGLGALSIAVYALAFTLACPGWLLENAAFVYGVAFESGHVMHHGEIYFQHTGPGWIYIIARNLDAGMGLPLLILALAGVVLACVKRRPGDLILAAYALPTYLILGAAQSRYARYEIALLPVLAVWAARLVAEMAVGLTDTGERRAQASPLWTCAGVLIVVFTAFDAWNLLLPMSQPDPRERAAVWIEANEPGNAVIATGGDPWFYTAAVDPYFAWYPVEGWRDWTGQDISKYCYNPSTSLDPATIDVCKAPVTTVSEFQYFDPLRLGEKSARIYFQRLAQVYGPPIIFASHHPLGGMREIDGLPTQDLPTDMLYPSPTVLVYAKH